jgi:hypothetical protein
MTKRWMLALLTLVLGLALFPATAEPPTETAPDEVTAEPIQQPLLAEEPAACEENLLFADTELPASPEATALDLHGGPCTTQHCISDYECKQFCGLAGGRCGFFDCPGHCYCFY